MLKVGLFYSKLYLTKAVFKGGRQQKTLQVSDVQPGQRFPVLQTGFLGTQASYPLSHPCGAGVWFCCSVTPTPLVSALCPLVS